MELLFMHYGDNIYELQLQCQRDKNNYFNMQFPGISSNWKYDYGFNTKKIIVC